MKQTFYFVTVLIVMFSAWISGATAQSEIRMSWQHRYDTQKKENRWQVIVLAKSETPLPGAAPEIRCPDSIRIESVVPPKTEIRSDRFTPFYISLAGNGNEESVPVRISLPGGEVRLSLSSAVDLLQSDWQSFYPGKDVWLNRDFKLPDENATWKKQELPKLWPELGITWLRTRFFVPEHWKSYPIRLTISAVDDNEATFVNGREVGRTHGWDTLRQYSVPKDLLKYGEMNEILIAAENVNAGGGIAAGPVRIGPDSAEENQATLLFPVPERQAENERQKPRQTASALPLRPMTVRDGVLEYTGGGEVTLWGVNYYPQSWNEYRFLKEQGVDFKAAIDADLDDLLQNTASDDPNRINVIRIHVFDSEIADSDGRLYKNEHLDLLDYLAARCNERGVYIWLTPIAWWGSPQGLPDNFAQNVPMQAMTLCQETWPAQQRYMKSFLEHENPYTKRRLVDEPCLVLFEIINEPLYWTLDQLTDVQSRPHGRVWTSKEKENTDQDPNISFRKKIREEWRKTLPDESWESDESWNFFVYSRVRQYIDTMYETIRGTGARQPISYCAADFNTNVTAFQAIADSRCDAVTLVFYTGLEQKPVADVHNQLPKTADRELPVMLSKKARLVYEFDASDTLKQIDNYPAIARHFRNMGVQVACQFQYDSRFNADHNRAWPTHYLNAIHTPERFSSFLIGGETFRTLQRGTRYKPENPDQWIFPPTAVSYSLNAAFLCKNDLYIQARPADWQPLSRPESPRRMIGVGSTPYYDYPGTGMVDLKIEGGTALLRLKPDVVRLRHDTLQGTPEEPLTKLETARHPFKLKLPGWQNAVVEIETETGQKGFVPLDGCELETGQTYRLKRSP